MQLRLPLPVGNNAVTRHQVTGVSKNLSETAEKLGVADPLSDLLATLLENHLYIIVTIQRPLPWKHREPAADIELPYVLKREKSLDAYASDELQHAATLVVFGPNQKKVDPLAYNNRPTSAT
ncbi:hypothetical protein FRB94_008494 [Tulasnella sp. JGI-2019a]|nr:hypothetical protein FRB93_010837 [Tulasnella sp. JGI-2019a]KAG9011423.1 hypothetical protein FRB94_008494 [Tulasnella sp. JGI-2019a]KAG9036086.1 hypothetical protein FRB95_009874 [Tulasnella sp. JGI-2019a]